MYAQKEKPKDNRSKATKQSAVQKTTKSSTLPVTQCLTHAGNFAFTHRERAYAVQGADVNAQAYSLWVRNDAVGRDAGDELNYLGNPNSFFHLTGTQQRITGGGVISAHQNAILYDEYIPRARFNPTLAIPALPAGFWGPARGAFYAYAPMNGPEDCVQYARAAIGRDMWWGFRNWDGLDSWRIAVATGALAGAPIAQPQVNLIGGGVANFDYTNIQQVNNVDRTRDADHRDMMFTVGNQIRNWLIGVGPFNFHGEAVIANASGSNKVVSKACVGEGNVAPTFTLYGVRDEFDPMGVNHTIRSFDAKYTEDPNNPINNNQSGTVHH